VLGRRLIHQEYRRLVLGEAIQDGGRETAGRHQ
jgi:hypothetical protein